MNDRLRHLACVTAVGLTVMLAGSLVAGEAREFESEHYVIATDIDAETAKRLARHMDAMYAEYQRRLAGFSESAEDRLRLWIFDRADDYVAFLADCGIEARGTDGMFFDTAMRGGLATWRGDRPVERLEQVLRHEGFHQFAWRRIGPTLPPWANEGLAEYFAEAIVIDGNLKTGQVNARRLRQARSAVRAGRHVPFEQMLTLDNAAWAEAVAATDGGGALLYDQAWSMAHFLINARPKLREAFAEYLSRLSHGATAREAFVRAFGTTDFHAFESGWRRYLMQLQADPIHTAIERLTFLARGLRYLHSRGVRVESVEQLKGELRAAGFKVIHLAHEVPAVFSAFDEAMFEAPAHPEGESTGLELVSGNEARLPPRLVVRGLDMAVWLNWRIDRTGELRFDIALD